MRDLEFKLVRVGLKFRRNLSKSSVPFFSKNIDSFVQLLLLEFFGVPLYF